ncbi:GNAT family N-acetyltransferase [Lactococcus nasutitermitis]|uniref:GNAT family N-acetyltransferase n=1 Tax=Lactococcus nasutitermitis TaxID=1652957 RepID=A0ABV9JBW2_9LACT|nr:GNAT family N-acetyltransferase [Lactococcus nasutitermitis]
MSTEVIVREAKSSDSLPLIKFLDKVGAESHFLTMDDAGILMGEEEMSEYLIQISEKDNNAYFLALVNGEIAGVLAVTADFHYRIRHIGDIFIAVANAFQGYGIASILFGDMIDWVVELGVIKRLELTVQKRNEKARHLYEKFEFECESVRKNGARDEHGNLIDVCEYVRFFE